MIFDDIKHNFNLFMDNWSPEDDYVIYGASKDAPRLIESMDHLLKNYKLKVTHIIDDDENSKILYDYPIGSVSEVYKFNQSSYVPKKFKRKNEKKDIKIIKFDDFMTDENL